MSFRIVVEALRLVTWWGVTAHATSAGERSIGVRWAARPQGYPTKVQ